MVLCRYFDCPRDIYTSVSEDGISSEYSWFRWCECHTHTHTKSLILIQKVKMRLSAGDDFTGMSGVTIECTNPQSVIK